MLYAIDTESQDSHWQIEIHSDKKNSCLGIYKHAHQLLRLQNRLYLIGMVLTDCGIALDFLCLLDCDFPFGIHLPYHT